MKNLQKIKAFEYRQARIAHLVASGLSLCEIARQNNISRVHLTKMLRSPVARETLQTILEDAEKIEQARLPVLVAKALDELEAALNSPKQETRLKAAGVIAGILARHQPSKDGGNDNAQS